MAKDLTVTLEDRPGTLAAAAEALGKANVNIDGVCGVVADTRGKLHFLVEDAAGARRALEGAGFKIDAERDVLVLNIEDRPGSLGALARRLANAGGVNITLIYLATRTRVVIGADNMEAARKAAM